MRLQDDEIVMDKTEFLTNTLLAGIPCQLLAESSRRDLNEWMEYLSDRANEQYEQMTPKRREDMINAYIQISQQ